MVLLNILGRANIWFRQHKVLVCFGLQVQRRTGMGIAYPQHV